MGLFIKKARSFLTLPESPMIDYDYFFLNFLLNPARPTRPDQKIK
jgi:hypothetical protein